MSSIFLSNLQVVPCFVFPTLSLQAALKLGQLRLREIEYCAGVANSMSST